jgi:hypothetical protein
MLDIPEDFHKVMPGIKLVFKTINGLKGPGVSFLQMLEGMGSCNFMERHLYFYFYFQK